MSRSYLYFSNSRYRKTDNGLMIPDCYDFWESLASYLLMRCNKFRIDCYRNEDEAIASASMYSKPIASQVANMLIFEGDITEEFINEIISNPFDQDGKIKWFSLFLRNDNERVLSCEHYGSEFVTGWLEIEEQNYIRTIIPEEFVYHLFSEEKYKQ